MNVFQLTVLAADKPFYDGPCESLRFPGSDGQYGIQANHRNMIAAIVPGTLRFQTAAEEQVAAISEGLIKVEDNHVLILADTIERPEDIDVNRAKRDADEAREILLQKRSLQDHHTARARMVRALNRLHVREQWIDN
ncbi:MAG: ATP synthase F1 subunit epsilon [Oscillospiraceae bacterium]|jgi:F-type H+-transporting ATPase subunit epsilon|nr:ATP synthase F1 subunit epsilon [Oscillospiraceae bacterium]